MATTKSHRRGITMEVGYRYIPIHSLGNPSLTYWRTSAAKFEGALSCWNIRRSSWCRLYFFYYVDNGWSMDQQHYHEIFQAKRLTFLGVEFVVDEIFLDWNRTTTDLKLLTNRIYDSHFSCGCCSSNVLLALLEHSLQLA